MVPRAKRLEDFRSIQTVSAAAVPANGKRAVAAVVEKELAPTRTDLMRIVGVLVVAHPEFYRGLPKQLIDGTRNGDATGVKVHDLIGSHLWQLEDDGIRRRRLLPVLSCLIDGPDGIGFLGAFI